MRNRLLLAGLLAAATAAHADLTLDFETGTLPPGVSVSWAGSFHVTPSIQPATVFGSTLGFGFGLSTCRANCFGAYQSTLTIDLGGPTFVDSISFREIEAFNNWGSGGQVLIDGVPLTPGAFDFGRMPYNDAVADRNYRTHSFTIGREVSTIAFRVTDITDLSEIFIDDVQIGVVPEPTQAALFAAGLVALAAWRLRHHPSTRGARP